MISPSAILSSMKSGLTWITNPENFKIIGLVIVIGMVVGLVHQHRTIQDLERTEAITKSNLAALNSELEIIERENGMLLAERGALQANLGDLKELNNELAETVEDLENNPITITEVIVESKTDTIVDIPTAGEYLGESRFKLTWEYENSGTWGSRLLKGTNEFNVIGDDLLTKVQTDILIDQFSLRLRTGFRETDDGLLRVYAETDYPNIEFINIDGAIVDPNYFSNRSKSDKPNWVIGPQVGITLNSDSKIRPTIGIGITYNLWGWN